MSNDKTKEILISIPPAGLNFEPAPPSPFELGVIEQLKGLAEELTFGYVHIQHFSLTVSGDKQRLEIEVL